MWQSIQAWFKSKGGYAHVVGAAIIAAVTAYGAVPPFHQLVIDVWAKTPPFAREAGLAIVSLYGWYKQTNKGAPSV